MSGYPRHRQEAITHERWKAGALEAQKICLQLRVRKMKIYTQKGKK